jgi:hypothetical protein
MEALISGQKYPADFTSITTDWNTEIKDEKLILQAWK